MTERDPVDVQAEREADAEHGELGPRDPRRDAFTLEEESDLSGAEYGESDDTRTRDRPDVA